MGPTLSNPPTRRDIPLAAVTGSVDRSRDFTSDFLPLLSSDEERWIRVRNAMVGETGVPPIVVYGLRGRYFVIDGHHRVSVAKRFGQPSIEAYVTEVTPVRRPVGRQEVEDEVIENAPLYFPAEPRPARGRGSALRRAGRR